MKITVASSAGFCFGVDRAVQIVFDLLQKGKKVYTLGPIIHNPQMVQELEERGVTIVNSPDEVPEEGTVVIRSHGIPPQVQAVISERQLDCADATCPFVRKIHRIVSRARMAKRF